MCSLVLPDSEITISYPQPTTEAPEVKLGDTLYLFCENTWMVQTVTCIGGEMVPDCAQAKPATRKIEGFGSHEV